MRPGAAVVAAVAAVAATGALGDGGADSQLVEKFSFYPPYKTFDNDGMRRIDNWRYGGDAVANENFVRLVQDRANKKGYLWSANTMEVPEWSATLRFRISGQGKNLFGDGLALWFTTDTHHRAGQLHGYAEKFVGFGIIFDTFVNERYTHKDVALVVNNGTMDKIAPHGGLADPHAPGCDGDFRFHEGRDDFSVQARSAVKIVFRPPSPDAGAVGSDETGYGGGAVSILLDSRNTGEWVTCVDNAPVNHMPRNWWDKARFGLTSTTGQLADNHDIISFLVSDDPDAPALEEPTRSGPVLPPALADGTLEGDGVAGENAGPGLPFSSGVIKVDAAIKAAVSDIRGSLEDRIETLEHHLEYQLSAVHDGLNNNVKKINEKEAAVEKRVTAVESELASRLSREILEQLRSDVDERVGKLERQLRSALGGAVRDSMQPIMDEKLEGLGGGWYVPFGILLILIVGLAYVNQNRYSRIMKTHLP